jgi:hypothetical protein
MKTAAHSTFTGPGRICISIGNPRGVPGGYKMFRALAPSRDLLNSCGNDQEAYRARFYSEILGALDPRETWDKLHALANGAEPVLQCFERPPFTCDNWCHRRMVADWFKETLGETVDELTPETREQRHERDRERLAAKVAPGVDMRVGAPPLRPLVEAVRAEIDAWWKPILARLGEVRNWSWMGMPDRIRARLDFGQIAEWQILQARYTDVDVAH